MRQKNIQLVLSMYIFCVLSQICYVTQILFNNSENENIRIVTLKLFKD